MGRNRKAALVGLVAMMSMLGVLAPASADHVAIDIIPDSPHNAIKTLQAIVPVAVLGSATLDVADVDADSLCFGSAERPRARNCSPEDGLRVRDTNGDGFADLRSGSPSPGRGFARTTRAHAWTGHWPAAQRSKRAT
jgi:hypothetical protein